MTEIRVVVAEDHTLVRSGICDLLAQEPDIVVVGEAKDGNEALSLVEELTPDVLLLDIEMPGLTGLEVARKLHAARSPVQILALSAYADREYTLGLLANGAAGYLTKDEAPQRVVEAVRGVFNGKDGWLSRRVAIQLVAAAQEGQADKPALTDSETQVLRLVVAGKTNPEISAVLGFEAQAVEAHLHKILTKLGGTSRMKVALQAVREGLTAGTLTKVHLLIVDEIQLMSQMVVSFLESEPDLEVIGSATSVAEALALLKECDMVLVNAALPDNGALRLVQTISRAEPSVKILVMGLREIEPAVVQYVEAGADGFVHRDDSPQTLLEHIRAARRDAALVSPRIAATLISRLNELATAVSEHQPTSANLEELTPREREVLELMGQGLNNEEVANRLFITRGTVKNHAHKIYKKLNASSRKEAIAFLPLLHDSQG